jgi:hypothetical protein
MPRPRIWAGYWAPHLMLGSLIEGELKRELTHADIADS